MLRENCTAPAISLETCLFVTENLQVEANIKMYELNINHSLDIFAGRRFVFF